MPVDGQDSRRPNWLVALVMLAGGGTPLFVLGFLSTSVWSGVIAGLLFWPCAFIAGCLATAGEEHRA